MRIISWNVNGIRAVMNKGFLDWFTEESPDILCLQEVKAFEHQIPTDLRFVLDKEGYKYLWHAGKRPGYAGTAIFYKSNIDILDGINNFDSLSHFDEDGRVVEIDFELGNTKYALLNLYFPNGGTRANGQEMLSYKKEFYDKFLAYISRKRDNGYAIITCGDFNVCHKEIDIARPKENEKSIGFLPEERAKIDEIIANDFVDVFRLLYPEQKDQYSRWSYRAGARARNVGRRIDYFFVSKELGNKIKDVKYMDDVMGSDHCPLYIEIDI